MIREIIIAISVVGRPPHPINNEASLIISMEMITRFLIHLQRCDHEKHLRDDTLLFMIASLEMILGDDPKVSHPFHASNDR